MGKHFDALVHKITEVTELQKRMANWRSKGETIVFTNGCFDILHKGHVTYLAEAAAFGSRLVVGLNTDASVKRQGKGEERPINPEDARALVMASLEFVDAVVFFDADTPIDLITALQPDVLVKGADYDPAETDPRSAKYIVGSQEVRAHGGEVKVVDLVQGFSTTAILTKAAK